jgi:hypothetical protein
VLRGASSIHAFTPQNNTQCREVHLDKCDINFWTSCVGKTIVAAYMHCKTPAATRDVLPDQALSQDENPHIGSAIFAAVTAWNRPPPKTRKFQQSVGYDMCIEHLGPRSTQRCVCIPKYPSAPAPSSAHAQHRRR